MPRAQDFTYKSLRLNILAGISPKVLILLDPVREGGTLQARPMAARTYVDGGSDN